MENIRKAGQPVIERLKMGNGFELVGMSEFMQQIQNMGEKADPAIKKAVTAGGEIIKVNLVKKIPRSAILRAANKGANSWRSGEHAADHIKTSKSLGKDGSFYTLTGISRADASQWFYLKFIEYDNEVDIVMKSIGFQRVSSQDLYEDDEDTKIFHKAMRYSIITS